MGKGFGYAVGGALGLLGVAAAIVVCPPLAAGVGQAIAAIGATKGAVAGVAGAAGTVASMKRG